MAAAGKAEADVFCTKWNPKDDKKSKICPLFSCLPAKVRRMLPDDGLCSWSRGTRHQSHPMRSSSSSHTSTTKEPARNHHQSHPSTPQTHPVAVSSFCSNPTCQDVTDSTHPTMAPSCTGPAIIVNSPQESLEGTRFFVSAEDVFPSAPSPGLIYFEREDESDVVFKGAKPYIWRMHAHSFIWANASPVLKERYHIVASQQSSPNPGAFHQHSYQHSNSMESTESQDSTTHQSLEIEITDVKAETFYKLLRFIYTNQNQVNSVPECLEILEAARKYKISGLASCCLDFLEQNVTKDNVLKIVQQLRPSDSDSVCNEPSDNQQNELFEKCMDLIDRNAEELLKSSEFHTLDRDLVDAIVSRDTLKISSDIVVYKALEAWGIQQCKAKHVEPVPTNVRELLGSMLLFRVRFLVMDKEEFRRGPLAGGILTDEEKNAIKERLEGKTSHPLPKHMGNYKLDVKRRGPSADDSELSSSSPASRKTPKIGSGGAGDSQDGHRDPTFCSRKGPHLCGRKKNSTFRRGVSKVVDAIVFVVQLLD